MEPPRMGQTQFDAPRMEPIQPRMGTRRGFRFKPPQRFEPIRNEPYREHFRFEQPYDQRAEFRNEPPRNEQTSSKQEKQVWLPEQRQAKLWKKLL